MVVISFADTKDCAEKTVKMAMANGFNADYEAKDGVMDNGFEYHYIISAWEKKYKTAVCHVCRCRDLVKDMKYDEEHGYHICKNCDAPQEAI